MRKWLRKRWDRAVKAPLNDDLDGIAALLGDHREHIRFLRRQLEQFKDKADRLVREAESSYASQCKVRQLGCDYEQQRVIVKDLVRRMELLEGVFRYLKFLEDKSNEANRAGQLTD